MQVITPDTEMFKMAVGLFSQITESSSLMGLFSDDDTMMF